MQTCDTAIIGAGPAGLSAAIAAAEMGAGVALIERNNRIGGQLIKQTHAFFGSEKQYASYRGIYIPDILYQRLSELDKVQIMLDTKVQGYYPDDGVLGLENGSSFFPLKAKKIIVATGASEKTLAFPNNDLPGVYGAGAVQTLMNVHGVRPGRRVLMVGSGNIGLIVGYQLIQAGVELASVIEAAPHIGGYLVHASKLRRMGVPILTSHTITSAYGQKEVEGATICRLDEQWQPVSGTERDVEVDTICVSVGLSPMADILWQMGCEMRYVPQLGGHVSVRNEKMQTSVDGVFIAGDVASVEEASSAMMEGRIAGLAAAESLGCQSAELKAHQLDAWQELKSLRSGPVGEKIRAGIHNLTVEV
ncbi:MAG: FAD-dependent oxidoreductase [Desulfovermiculus sp.]|nr:FAD-dependent oxidoreductase [Desulfovermiculus sp.]